jgi:hypothetical protein
MRLRQHASIILLLVLAIASCGKATPVGPTTLETTDELIVALQQQGAHVVRGESLSRESMPCFSASSSQSIIVNGGHVSVYEYPTVAAAESDAARVSSNGSGTTSGGCAALILWIGPPHFYKNGRLIVIYAGSADSVLQPLEAVLGKPFVSR